MVRLACLGLLTCALTGCGKSASGIFSHSDYAYAADSAEQVGKARARFENAVAVFQSAGMRAVSVNQTETGSETILRAPGREAQIAFLLPNNGFATIRMVYTSEGGGRAEAEALLVRAQETLRPD